MQMIKVRIRATGQVTDMVPNVARRMIAGGTAEEVKKVPVAESMAVSPVAERAVAPAQAGPSKKKLFSRGRAS